MAVAVVVAGCADRVPPSGAALPPAAVTGNALQPLAVGLTWTYDVTTADPTDSNAAGRFAVAVVGTETVGGEPAWLIENAVATSYASRAVAVIRDGDVWAVAIDSIVDGAWQRTVLPAAQIFQPGAREVSWGADYSAGPEVFRFKGEWSQRSSGQITVLGQVHPGWLVEGTVSFDASTSYREVDTYAEGIGPVSFSTFFEGGGQRPDLRSFGTDLPGLNGRWAGSFDDADVTLEIGLDGATIAFGEADAAAVEGWTVADTAISFTVVRDGATRAVRLIRQPWALVGTVEGQGGPGRILELRPDDRPLPDPTPVPGSSAFVLGG